LVALLTPLRSAGQQSLLSHKIKINASNYLPTDPSSIPTGKSTVESTAFDFREAKPIGEKIDELKDVMGSGGEVLQYLLQRF